MRNRLRNPMRNPLSNPTPCSGVISDQVRREYRGGRWGILGG
jgi:hypothetical protein